jgi:hypothetical protein
MESLKHQIFNAALAGDEEELERCLRQLRHREYTELNQALTFIYYTVMRIAQEEGRI